MRARSRKALEVGRVRLYSRMETSTKVSLRVENDTVQVSVNSQQLVQSLKESGERTSRWVLVFCSPYQTN